MRDEVFLIVFELSVPVVEILREILQERKERTSINLGQLEQTRIKGTDHLFGSPERSFSTLVLSPDLAVVSGRELVVFRCDGEKNGQDRAGRD